MLVSLDDDATDELDLVLGQTHHLLGEAGDELAQRLVQAAKLTLRRDGGRFHPIPGDNWLSYSYEAVFEVAPSLVPEFTSEITDRIWNKLEPVLRRHGRQDVFGIVVQPTIPPLPDVAADWRARAEQHAAIGLLSYQARRERANGGYPVAEEPSVRPATAVTVGVVGAEASSVPGGAGGNGTNPREVFVVHGRDVAAKEAVFAFLRDLDLRPLDWEHLVAMTGSAAPYVGDAVACAFPRVQAVVVILTPDDEARLLPALHRPDEPPHETNLMGQARPNVLFEAGMALALHPERTVLVEIGRVRPFSDVAGRHMVRLTGEAPSLHSLARRLKTAGCPVDITGSTWLNECRFRDLAAWGRSTGSAPLVDPAIGTNLPRGTVRPPRHPRNSP